MRQVVLEFAASKDCRYGDGQEGIDVDKRSMPAKGLMSNAWLEHFMPPDQWLQIQPMIDELRNRNSSVRSLKWDFTDASGVTVRDFSKDADVDAMAETTRCAVTLSLPSYSRSGEQAVLVMHVMPSAHGAIAMVVADRSSGDWHISFYKLFEFV
jgi:hypothetical protein